MRIQDSNERGDPREKKFKSICEVMEGLGAVKARLVEALPLCWERIPETQFENLGDLFGAIGGPRPSADGLAFPTKTKTF